MGSTQGREYTVGKKPRVRGRGIPTQGTGRHRAQGANSLSLEDLEALASEKRRYLAEEKVRRIVAAEGAQDREPAPEKPDARTMPESARSPEAWRGSRAGDRRFHSLAMSPLSGSKTAKGSSVFKKRRPAGTASTSVAAPPRRRGRDILLLVVEIGALIGFLVIMRLSYVRLQDLNRQSRQAQQMLVETLSATETAEPSATPTITPPIVHSEKTLAAPPSP